MLVLTRKTNQSILIGDDIEIVVLEIKGGQIRLGINAPRSTAILRKEIFQEVHEENRKAALLSQKKVRRATQLLPPPDPPQAGTPGPEKLGRG